MTRKQILSILLSFGVAISTSLIPEPATAATYADTTVISFDPTNASSYSGTGTTLNNLGSLGNTAGTQGTLSSVTYDATDAGGAFVFNGSSSRINFGQYNFGTSFTISSWVKPEAQYSINTLVGNAAANQQTLGFKLGWNSWNSSDRKIYFEAGNGSSGSAVTTVNSNQVVETEWQHLTYVVNTSAQTISMYRNGNLICTTGTMVSGVGVNNATWWIGTMSGAYYLKGKVGKFKIFNSLLTASDVSTEFNATNSAYGVASTSTSLAPLAFSSPEITGTAQSGQTLTTSRGSWNNCVDSYAVKWQSSATQNGTYADIPSATNATYVIQVGDVGKYLKTSITATNTNGSNTSFSAAVYIAIPPDTPGAPTGTAGNASATMTIVPAGTGGSPASYTITANGITPTKSCTVTVPATSCTITGLTNGTQYRFSATATNAAGTSSASLASEIITPAAGPVSPGTPGTPTATTGNGQASITISAPNSGGTPDSYTVTSNPGSLTCTVTVPATTCTISGLTNGTAYTFSSTATNGGGTSSASASSASVTPSAPAAASTSNAAAEAEAARAREQQRVQGLGLSVAAIAAVSTALAGLTAILVNSRNLSFAAISPSAKTEGVIIKLPATAKISGASTQLADLKGNILKSISNKTTGSKLVVFIPAKYLDAKHKVIVSTRDGRVFSTKLLY